jgi:serine protease AprX
MVDLFRPAMKRTSLRVWLLLLIVGIGVAGVLVLRTNRGAGADNRNYPDVRFKDLSARETLDRAALQAMWFNTSTNWAPKVAELSEAILRGGMNPGLGVRSLHQQGITGQGAAVGIIDQNLFLDHPEYQGRIAQYKDFGCHATRGSMHGPAVASLLVGKNVGTAPGATLYFAAAPSWTGDAKYYAEALDWLVALNETLPAGAKIRVVSVSAAPSGPGSPFKAHNELWDAACARAKTAGVLVLDCTQHRGVIGPCHYDLEHPDDLGRVTPGFPGRPFRTGRKVVLAPCSRRSQAEEYDQGVCGYQYTGQGGLSWSIPYAAGVLALGWQIKPDLTPDRMIELLFQTAYEQEGCRIINPVAFVAAVRRES